MAITNPDDPKFRSNCVLDYSNMSYDTMVAMQEAVSKALVDLDKAPVKNG